ncbi:MAG: glycoside hydrolase domain-containing protein [Saprospiraceae bacterium]
MSRYAFLRELGRGLAPVYVGQQQPEPYSPGAHIVTAAQGTLDAADRLAVRAGFSLGSVLYPDIETDGPISSELKQYYLAWVQGVVSGGFSPGVYCSYRLAAQFSQLDRRPRFWVFRVAKGPTHPATVYPHPYPTVDPMASAVPFASLWQHVQGADLSFAGGQLLRTVDLDSCSLRDPAQLG